jgi:hypothetical protein
MSTRIPNRRLRRPARPPAGRGTQDGRAALRALVESLAQEIHLPRGVPSAPGQQGYAAFRAARERLLAHQLDLVAEGAREQARRLGGPQAGRAIPRSSRTDGAGTPLMTA